MKNNKYHDIFNMINKKTTEFDNYEFYRIINKISKTFHSL